jgi:hypothetical protein
MLRLLEGSRSLGQVPLEMRYGATHREFESPPLRSITMG